MPLRPVDNPKRRTVSTCLRVTGTALMVFSFLFCIASRGVGLCPLAGGVGFQYLELFSGCIYDIYTIPKNPWSEKVNIIRLVFMPKTFASAGSTSNISPVA